MEFSKDNFLTSKSGYAMPFSSIKYKDAKFIKDYGLQEDGGYNSSIDILTHNYELLALADGEVDSIYTNQKGETNLRVKYGDFYKVSYGNLSKVLYPLGHRVKAFDVIAISLDVLYIEVTFKDEKMDPKDFLRMILGNIKGIDILYSNAFLDSEFLDKDILTKYDDKKEEIQKLMLKYLPQMLEEISHGKYIPNAKALINLQNIFSLSFLKDIFFEKPPTISNPLGLSLRAIPYISKAMEVLTQIFLGFIALRYNIFLEDSDSDDSDSKKKVLMF